jgi:PPM family protein phosphatase
MSSTTILHAGFSDRGRRLAVNEDRWLADADLGLYLVADGLADERAPQLIVERLPQVLNQRKAEWENLTDSKAAEAVRKSLAELSIQIRDQSRQDPELPELAATIVMALVRDQQALIAHLGDCRAYLWREGFLEQVTRDHTLVQRLLGLGVLNSELASRYPLGGGPTSFMGMKGEPQPAVRLLPLWPGDWLLLCSDGLTHMINDWAIHDILTQTTDPSEACRRLVDAANEAGGRDNITVLAVIPVSKSQPAPLE